MVFFSCSRGSAVTELRQLDLQLAVAALGPLREDVEDQHRPVDHLQIGEVGDGVRLHRRQIGIEDQRVGVDLHGADQDLLQLAATDQVLRIGLVAALLHHAADADVGRATELAQLGDPSAGIGAAGPRGRGSARALAAQIDDDQQRARARVGRHRRGRDPLELLLQRLGQRHRVERAVVERLARQDAPGRLPRQRRQEVGDVQIRRPPVGLQANRRDQIQAQQRQVDEIVARQRLVAQVGVHEAQAPEAPAPGPQAANLRKVDPRGVADEDVLDLAAPVDQDPDLSLDLARHGPQKGRQLGRRHLRGLQAPPVDALQGVLLARLEPDDIAGDGLQEAEVSMPLPATIWRLLRRFSSPGRHQRAICEGGTRAAALSFPDPPAGGSLDALLFACEAELRPLLGSRPGPRSYRLHEPSGLGGSGGTRGLHRWDQDGKRRERLRRQRIGRFHVVRHRGERHRRQPRLRRQHGAPAAAGPPAAATAPAVRRPVAAPAPGVPRPAAAPDRAATSRAVEATAPAVPQAAVNRAVAARRPRSR